MIRSLIALSLACLVLGLGGCIGHYRVTDPQTGQTYYTREFQREGDERADVRFKDAKTDTVYLLHVPEIKQISKGAYADAVKAGS